MLKINNMTYKFTVEDKDGEMIYTITAPTQEMLEEKMGAYERHVKEGMTPVGKAIWIR